MEDIHGITSLCACRMCTGWLHRCSRYIEGWLSKHSFYSEFWCIFTQWYRGVRPLCLLHIIWIIYSCHLHFTYGLVVILMNISCYKINCYWYLDLLKTEHAVYMLTSDLTHNNFWTPAIYRPILNFFFSSMMLYHKVKHVVFMRLYCTNDLQQSLRWRSCDSTLLNVRSKMSAHPLLSPKTVVKQKTGKQRERERERANTEIKLNNVNFSGKKNSMSLTGSATSNLSSKRHQLHGEWLL